MSRVFRATRGLRDIYRSLHSLSQTRDELSDHLNRIEREFARAHTSQATQVALRMEYNRLKHSGAPLPSFRDVGFRSYSQFEEDGILLYIFSLIGETTRTVVELCAGDAFECMATNLILNHGWEGFLFDGSERNVARGIAFFKAHPDSFLLPPIFTHAWITAENVDEVLVQAGAIGDIDLLSIDVDGNDYWIWRAISAVRPRVLLIETNNVIPSDLALTIQYAPDFSAWTRPKPEHDYIGASLLAMEALSRSKGYRLVGTHRHGFNAFFVRDDLARDLLPTVSVSECHQNTWTRLSQAHRWKHVKHMPWVPVDSA